MASDADIFLLPEFAAMRFGVSSRLLSSLVRRQPGRAGIREFDRYLAKVEEAHHRKPGGQFREKMKLWEVGSDERARDGRCLESLLAPCVAMMVLRSLKSRTG
jgi:hypothetical protein